MPAVSTFKIIKLRQTPLNVSTRALWFYDTCIDNFLVTTVMGVFAVAAIFSEIGNGANFSLVPHCNPFNNVSSRRVSENAFLTNTLQGVMSGIVGGFGNLGGIFFALIFRFQTASGKPFWIIGAIAIAVNAILTGIPVPKY